MLASISPDSGSLQRRRGSPRTPHGSSSPPLSALSTPRHRAAAAAALLSQAQQEAERQPLKGGADTPRTPSGFGLSSAASPCAFPLIPSGERDCGTSPKGHPLAQRSD